MLNPNRVLSKSQILDHVWDYDFSGDTGIVESYISSCGARSTRKSPAHPYDARRRIRAATATGLTQASSV